MGARAKRACPVFLARSAERFARRFAKSRDFSEKWPICGTFDTLLTIAPGAFTPSASCRVHPRPVGEEGLFKVGDKVVYPHHGAGTIVKKEKRVVLGEKREYLTIKILHNDMTVNVPCENAEAVGLRQVIDEEMVKKVTKALTGGGTAMPKNWNRRFKHNRDKMKTGDIFELAEVVRNLSLRDHEKGLSTGEKQMFVKAKKILASELMYAKGLDEDAAADWLDEVLSTNGTNGTKKKAETTAKSTTSKAKTKAGAAA
jgi:CarD family transcriptional regulator